jgi:hypothetical protein
VTPAEALATEATDTHREEMLQHLVRMFIRQGFTVKGVRGLGGFDMPPAVRNRGFGSRRDRVPDVVGMDAENRRIVFGLVRGDRKSLDSEDALEEYNVFLDHNEGLITQASLLLVLVPAALLPEFTSMITHYIHREYWHRVIPVAYESGDEEAGTPGGRKEQGLSAS